MVKHSIFFNSTHEYKSKSIIRLCLNSETIERTIIFKVKNTSEMRLPLFRDFLEIVVFCDQAIHIF